MYENRHALVVLWCFPAIIANNTIFSLFLCEPYQNSTHKDKIMYEQNMGDFKNIWKINMNIQTIFFFVFPQN